MPYKTLSPRPLFILLGLNLEMGLHFLSLALENFSLSCSWTLFLWEWYMRLLLHLPLLLLLKDVWFAKIANQIAFQGVLSKENSRDYQFLTLFFSKNNLEGMFRVVDYENNCSNLSHLGYNNLTNFVWLEHPFLSRISLFFVCRMLVIALVYWFIG